MRRAFLALALVLAGCGVGEGAQRSAQLLVTRDFGDVQLGRGTADGSTVLRALQRRFDVDTRFGGNFVHSIQGVDGGSEGGRRVDWFFYVNGIESSEGAGSFEISPGDRVWWDHHDWSGAMRIPAVVGSFPEPFLSGSKGERYPVRVDCAPSAAEQCDTVLQKLRSAGITRASQAGFGQPVGLETLRVLVGEWSEIRTDAAAARLEKGPELSGVFARFKKRGAEVELLDPTGEPVRLGAAGSGIVAATRFEDQAPTWLVTGTDRTGVSQAAAALDEGMLAGRFALAILAGSGHSLPVVQP